MDLISTILILLCCGLPSGLAARWIFPYPDSLLEVLGSTAIFAVCLFVLRFAVKQIVGV